ncbi:MAG: biopolymer transporter ExbD [Deltaproteobacteria bacterium]|nr:biopolymer transporter ExbD [Deltaproteobacteria bacterium]MCL5277032.1 biopolymer transporter ExbD [Deltaproteobacteria bacterium]
MHKRTREKKHTAISLNLTPMIDMFTILVVFLLKSYSATGYVGNVAKNLRLPTSTSRLQPQAVLTVAVTTKYILVEGKEVEAINQSDMTSQNLMLTDLSASLKKEADKGLQIEKLSNGANPFKGEMMIQADRSIPFRLLEKIMYTAGQAGYNTINLEVLQKTS